MLTFFLCIFALLTTKVAHAQQLVDTTHPSRGLVVYHQKIKRSLLDEQDDTLRFNRTASIFQWNTAHYTGNPGLKMMKKTFPNAKDGGHISGPKPIIYYGLRINFYDVRKDSLYSLMGMKNINKLLYLKEKAPSIHWMMLDSTKRVGNYSARKATANFRGHDYTAWFTPKIPVPYGPWKLHGLPGLILQAYDQSGNIYFSATDISFKDTRSIDPIPLTGHEQTVALEGYKKILDHYVGYEKQTQLKMVRPYVSNEDFENMVVHVQPINHMEIFEPQD